ncbi:MAG: methyltransferase domain-containing protein [Pseudomonadota bacterium]
MTKSLADAKRHYAEQIRARAQVTSPQILRAFRDVPRERFLGDGPWRIRSDIVSAYGSTGSADPAEIYHDVLVALDEDRKLDNGLPSLWALLFEALDVKPGENIVQIGCGTGYYTAILAQLVGESGQVTAIDSDRGFAEQAKSLLGDYENVQVVHGDGCQLPFESIDAVIVHAGVSHPYEAWLDALALGGRLQLTLTSAGRQGIVFQITRTPKGFRAQALRRIEIFPCDEGDGKTEASLRLSFWNPFTSGIKSLRRDQHEEDDTCWAHSENFCLSRQPV